MSSQDYWLQLDPWRELEGLVRLCADRTKRPISDVGRELEARLRDGRIPSRIKLDRVVPPYPRSFPVQQSEPLSAQNSGSTSNTTPPPPRPSWPRTTTDATVEGNGGWDRVDWVAGSIEALPVEAHWPSIEAMMRDIQEPPGPKRQSRLPAEKREAVMSAMHAKIDSGEMTAAALQALPKKQLPTLFSEAETTCYEARKRVLQSLESRQTNTD